jgi:hypothetical protein
MKIRELLTDESTWTQGAHGRDINGFAVNLSEVSRPTTQRFCILGAARRCYGLGAQGDAAMVAIKVGLGFGGLEDVAIWNDHPTRTFDDVKALVERLDI